MAQDQMKKTLAEGITGEQLQAIAGTNAEEDLKPKEVFMKMLKDTYGIEEEDFAAAGARARPGDQEPVTSASTAPSSPPMDRMTVSAPMRTSKRSFRLNRVSRLRRHS